MTRYIEIERFQWQFRCRWSLFPVVVHPPLENCLPKTGEAFFAVVFVTKVNGNYGILQKLSTSFYQFQVSIQLVRKGLLPPSTPTPPLRLKYILKMSIKLWSVRIRLITRCQMPSWWKRTLFKRISKYLILSGQGSIGFYENYKVPGILSLKNTKERLIATKRYWSFGLL